MLLESAAEFDYNLNVELTGSVEVITTPSDATVYLDDEDKGISPLTIHNLELGFYDLRIARVVFHP